MRARGWLIPALAGPTALIVLSGCSGDRLGPDVPTREPATAAVSPATTGTPAGTVSPLSGTRALLAETGTGRLAALDTAGTTLSLLDPTRPDAVRAVPLPVAGAALGQGRAGEVLVAAPERVLRVDAGTGAVTELPVDGDVHSVQTRTDGTLFAGTGEGKLYEFDPTGTLVRTVDGLVSTDAIALTGDDVTVLDRRQTTVTAIAGDEPGLMLRAGDGATNALADTRGRILVTDTAGGELQVYTADPLVLRQRFPVGSSPYAIAYDPAADVVWVTCTQSNEILGFDLSTGIPVQVGRFATVRQPDAVTVDTRTGDLLVASATGDGLQRIGADQRKRGQ
ncbi:YncE family protein [Nocardia thailandica]|uniref:YncE family protein n=1 Tax=Nocardia thailandica TaxID=257275 RepID=A0ABW6PRS6_9NOCA